MPKNHFIPPTGTASFLVISNWHLYSCVFERNATENRNQKDRVDGGNTDSKNAKAIRFKTKIKVKFSTDLVQ